MDSIFLWEFLASHGVDRNETRQLCNAHSLSIYIKSNGKTLFPSSEIVRVCVGDVITDKSQNSLGIFKVESTKVNKFTQPILPRDHTTSFDKFAGDNELNKLLHDAKNSFNRIESTADEKYF